MEIISIVTLSLSGLLLTLVGISRLSNPIKTYQKSSGITINNDVNLLNEVKGVGALMMLGGLLTLLGILVSQFTFTSHVIAALIFIGFAIGRLVSMGTDGKPNKQIVQGLIFELVLGPANAFCIAYTLMQ